MFNFFKRKKKAEPAAPAAPPKAAERPGVAPKGMSPESPRQPSPAKPSPESSEDADFRIGQTMRVSGLGDFLIHDVKGGKGKSGMGIVYIVLDATNATPYAVKTFQRWCLETPELVQRFLREAETWIRLEQHPNIVRAFYVSTLQGQPYVFLEYVAGSDLRKKLSAGALPIRNALRYAIQFCRGMDYAQKKVSGLVHRDIKPENCMFTPDDTLKITDFGLVKVLASTESMLQHVPASKGEPSESASQIFQTQKGEMGVGTLPYMAPEQFTEFSSVTVRADIYSFGIMLYEMLTGRRPLRARSAEEWYRLHSKVLPQDPHLHRPEISLALSQLVMRCIAKTPDERYLDFGVLEKELARLLKQEFQEEVSHAGTQEMEAWEVLNKGAALNNLGRTEEALACFAQALEILPRLDAAWLNKGVSLGKLGREKEALKCYETAIEINPNLALAWFNRGIIYQNREAFDEALASYERALTINPLHDAAWLNKGVILRKLLRSQEAIACYDKALTISPRSAVAWYNRGYALRQLGRAQEELYCYERAIALDGQYVDAWLNRGVVLRKLNRPIEALACYNKILEFLPRHADAWYNKGLVLRKLGQKREAQNAFQRAAALMPQIADELRRQGLL